jgi:hypothetical protein
LCGLLFAFSNASGTGTSAPQSPPDSNGYAGDAACRTCHAKEFQGYEQTRHHRTSQLPSSSAIRGNFTSGKNTLSTLNPQVNFRMDTKGDTFFETAITGKVGQKKTRTERIDLVIGSGRKGQTYLYWRGDQLFELPVSYWTATGRWANSPGYVDGSADFERPITPRCLECHTTSFTSRREPSASHFDRASFVLGISCERCHGPAADHVRAHSAKAATPAPTTAKSTSSQESEAPLSPAGLNRDRQINICAQCHGGVGESVKPPLSFRPGEPLEDSIMLDAFNPRARVDVHGNQVALLEKSRCFQSSSNMTCSTCHDLHAPEREAANYSGRCLTCHTPQACPTFANTPHSDPANCIDCHMPVQTSKSLVLDIEDEQVGARVRTHWIRVYPQGARPR